MASLIFDGWVWSYTRLKLFEQCPYAFAQKYIYKDGEDMENFYASFGSLMHKVLERWYRGELGSNQESMISLYLKLFPKYMDEHYIPGDMKTKYFMNGLTYLRGGVFAPPPSSIVGVEQQLEFKLGGYDFTGIIDLVYRNKDGTLTIMDHKSHSLKPRSRRKTPTKTDEELDEYLKQLYLYSYALEKLTDDKVSMLQFNCFKNRIIIAEQWSAEAQENAIDWAVSTIDTIQDTTEFVANPEFFYCRNLCGSRLDCEYKDNE